MTIGEPRVETIIFDVGGVLASISQQQMYETLAARCAPSTSPNSVTAVMRRTRWSLGQNPITDLHARLIEECGYLGGWPDFVSDFGSHIVPDHAMLDLVQEISATHRVILFSNTNAAHTEYFDAASHGRLAQIERYLSHEIGHVKPDPASYTHVTAAARLDPGRSLFIDDLPENVLAARAAGWQAEIFKGKADLEALLQSRGVLMSALGGAREAV